MRYDYVSASWGKATPCKVHSDLMMLFVNDNLIVVFCSCRKYHFCSTLCQSISSVYAGRRALEFEIGEAQLIGDSLQKDLETRKTLRFA